MYKTNFNQLSSELNHSINALIATLANHKLASIRESENCLVVTKLNISYDSMSNNIDMLKIPLNLLTPDQCSELSKSEKNIISNIDKFNNQCAKLSGLDLRNYIYKNTYSKLSHTTFHNRLFQLLKQFTKRATTKNK